MIVKKISILLMLSVFISACVLLPNSNSRPSWIGNYSVSGDKKVSVGSAMPHIRGFDAQRKLAESRAIDSMARQLGVKVSNIVLTSVTGNSSSASSNMHTESRQEVSGNIVKASFKNTWQDPKNKEYFVRMVQE
jgi:hypothetical protein